MDSILTVTVPGVFEDLVVLGNISGKQRLYRKRIGEAGAASDSDAVDGPRYYLSEQGTVSLTDEVAGEWKRLEFNTPSSIENGLQALPVFFETRYLFRAKCSAAVKSVSVYHRMAAVTDGFTFADRWLFGDIDFINTPGRFTLALDVKLVDGTTRRISFRFTVASVKMDVERDYKSILKKIEMERPGLVQNFLAKTFGDAGLSTVGASSKPAWYAIFESIFAFYTEACEKIIHDPHRRYVSEEEWRHPDQIKRWTPDLVNRFVAMPKDRQEQMWLRVGRIVAETDTQENRFVLHTLRDISGKLERFAEEYKSVKGISTECIQGVYNQKDAIDKLANHPFFKGVARYTGGGAQSLVLQQRPGYAQILTSWLKLKQALTPEGKGLDIGYRPLSALYEFWTFLAVRDLLRDKILKDYEYEEDPHIASLEHLLDTEEESRSSGEATLSRMGYRFKKDNVTVSLAFQQTYGTGEGEELFAVVYDQRPDIVLSIRVGDENDANADVFTYLFDAKYRVDELDGQDASPRDAIDDMHRYRDAILYRRQKAGYHHEIIGAYVLFPGRLGGTYDYSGMQEKENIGAIPLLPQPGHLNEFERFLRGIIFRGSKKEHLGKSIPPRGAFVALGRDEGDFLETEVVYGTYASDQLRWILDKHMYNLPVDESEKFGIVDMVTAEQKKILYLVAFRGTGGHRVFRLLPGVRKVTPNDLREMGYPRHCRYDEYWLFKLGEELGLR